MNFIAIFFSFIFSLVRCCWCIYLSSFSLSTKKSFKFIVCVGIVGRFFILLSQRRNGISSGERQQKRAWRCRFHYNAINLFPPTIVLPFSPSHTCIDELLGIVCACRCICCCVCDNDTVARDTKTCATNKAPERNMRKSHTSQKEIKKKQMMQWHGDERWWLAWKIVCMRWKKDKNKKIMRSRATNKSCRRRHRHCQHWSWRMMHFHLLFWCIHTFYPHSISVSISSRSACLNALLLRLLPLSPLANNLRIFQQHHHHPPRCYRSMCMYVHEVRFFCVYLPPGFVSHCCFTLKIGYTVKYVRSLPYFLHIWVPNSEWAKVRERWCVKRCLSKRTMVAR